MNFTAYKFITVKPTGKSDQLWVVHKIDEDMGLLGWEPRDIWTTGNSNCKIQVWI